MTDGNQSQSLRRFVITAKEGFHYHDNILFKDMFIPFCTEFDACRIDEHYILYNSQLLPTRNPNKTIVILEKECVNDMLWKVISRQLPIDLFKDQELTDYVHTFYANSEVIVDECKNISEGKLFRVWEQHLYFSLSADDIHLVPMKHLILARILNTDGLILRKTKEIYSDVVGLLPYNTHVIIQNKSFSEIPSHKNIKRFQLFNNIGWISSMSSFDGRSNIEVIGICENPFHYSTTIIKLDQSPFQDFSLPKGDGLCVICLHSEREVAVTHNGYGHMLYCSKCAEIMSERNEKCPLCRTDITQYIRIYQ